MTHALAYGTASRRRGRLWQATRIGPPCIGTDDHVGGQSLRCGVFLFLQFFHVQHGLSTSPQIIITAGLSVCPRALFSLLNKFIACNL